MKTWTIVLLATLLAYCSEVLPTSPPTDDEGTLPEPWLRIESDGIGILRLGTPLSELHGIEWSPGPVIDGRFRPTECGKAIGYKYGGIIACFTRDNSNTAVLDFLLIYPPYAGRTSTGIGIGTPMYQVEELLSESSDYFLPDFGVVCLGKRELHLSPEGNNRVGSMWLSSYIDDPNHICPEHIFRRD